MRKISKEELKTILEKHKLWLRQEDGGEKANLSGSDLSGSDLSGSDLSGSDLSGSDLRWSNLSWSNLSGSNLSESDLSGSDLSGSNLRWSNLSGSNLSESDLSGSNLSESDLSGSDLSGSNLRWSDLSGSKGLDSAKNLFYPLTCPEKGEYTAFKKAGGKVVELRISADAKRSSATGRKCRASKAVVVSITTLDGNPAGNEVCSDYDRSFVYRVGETVEVQNFDENRWNECAPGIHHYITREEAVRH